MKPEDQPEPAEAQGRDDPDSDAPPSSRLNPGLGLMDSFEPAKLAEGDRPKPSRKQLALRWLKRVTIAVVVIAVLGALGVVGVVEYYSRDLPSVAELKRGYDPPQVTKIYAADGSELASLFTERRTVVPLDQVPHHVKLAFLAAEDAHFYEHEGLNYLGMLRAMAANLRAGRTVQGGSTITQQVVKNLLLDSSRTYERKLRETILARRLEQHLTKDEIFALYLNHIYLGHGRYGVEEAARYYFGKSTKDLGLVEAAALAGLVASPERYSPRRGPEKNKKRREYVLGQMVDKQFITAALRAQASKAALTLAPTTEAESELAPEVVSYVKRLLEKQVGKERARKGGYSIKTTLDPALQAEARKAVRANLDQYMKRQKLAPPFTLEKRRLWGEPFAGTPKVDRIYVGVVKALDDKERTIDVQVGSLLGEVRLDDEQRYNAKRVPPSGFTKVGASLRVRLTALGKKDEKALLRLELGPQSALVAIDPTTRHVKAIVGSYEAVEGALDRATQAKRQPGSAFKPFVYGYALHSRRFTPATLLELPPTKKSEGEPRTLLLRQALAKSDNAAAQKVLVDAGPANVVSWAKALGIESELKPDVSLALGSYEVSPLEIANAYATYASGGEYAPAVLVTQIMGPGGQEVALPERPPKRRVMEAEEAYLITSLMTSVIKEGTGKRAQALGRAVAGKTGTTNDVKDAWFVGFTTDLVCSVWTGYDDAKPLGWGEQGAVTSLPGWVSFMQAAHRGRPRTDFPRPAKIVVESIDPATGLLAWVGQSDAIREEFLDGTVPEEVAVEDAGADAESESDAGAEALDSGLPEPSEDDPSEPPPEPAASGEVPDFPPPF